MDCVYSYYQVLYNQNVMICKRYMLKQSANYAVNKRVCGICVVGNITSAYRMSTLFSYGRQNIYFASAVSKMLTASCCMVSVLNM